MKNIMIILMFVVAASVLMTSINIVKAGPNDLEVVLRNTDGSSALEVQDSSGKSLLRMRSDGRMSIGGGTATPPSHLEVIGTVTAFGYVGNGSRLTGVRPEQDSVASAMIITNAITSNKISNGTILGEDLSTSIDLVTSGSITTSGQLLVTGGNFRLNSAGAITTTGITSSGAITTTGITSSGTITATSFSGDGSNLTNVTATEATGVSSSIVINTSGSITTSNQLVVSGGNFRVDSAGSITATAMELNGSATVSGNLTATGTITAGFFSGDGSLLTNVTGLNSAINFSTTGTISTSGELIVSGGNFRVDSAGSVTTNGGMTAVGTVTAAVFVGDGSLLTGVVTDSSINLNSAVVVNTTGTITTTNDLLVGTSGTTTTSVFFVDADKEIVGIGTNTPTSARLYIIGSSTSSTDVALNIVDSTASSKFYVNNSGNVGINTTNPAYLLEVVGSSSVSSLQIGSGTSTSSFSTSSKVALLNVVNASGTQTLYVPNDTGYLGIGTSTPSTTVEVVGNVKATSFEGDGSKLTGVTVSSVSALSSSVVVNTSGTITTTNDLLVGTTGSSTFFVDASEDTVGIGTSTQSATARLLISGSSTSSTDASLSIVDSAGVSTFYVNNHGYIGIGTTTPSYRLDVAGSSSVHSLKIGVGTITTNVGTNSTFTLLDVQNAEGTHTLYVDNKTGYLGVGTTTASSELYVVGVINGTSFVGDGSKLTGITATNVTSLSSSIVVNTTGTITTTNDLLVGTTGTGTLFVDVSKDLVGIGTSTPGTARLNIVGSSTSSSDASLQITNSLGTNTFYVSNSGYVGIGTTTPASQLHVLGTITASANILASSGTITANTFAIESGTVSVSLGSSSEILQVNGHLHVNGNLSKLTGTFDIPHPKPGKAAEGYRLRHSFVESPTRGDNLYRYRVEITVDGGEYVIQLPEYWRHLNENAQVWVTAIGQFANGYGYVDEDLSGLVIKGEKKGDYNVLLIGTRKDKFAKEFFDPMGVEYRTEN